MDSSTSRHVSGDGHDRPSALLLWIGVLGGPLVWLLLLQTNYVLSYVACETRQTWFLHVATATAVALVAVAGFFAWRTAQSPRVLEEPLSDPLSRDTPGARARWMALFAVASSAWFILVIISASVPVAVLRTCQ